MKLFAFLAVFAVAACDSATELVEAPGPVPPPPVTPVPAAVELSGTTFWAGGAVTLTSQAFSPLDVAPQLTIDGVAVPLERLSANAFRGEIPRTLSGSHDPVLLIGGEPTDLPAISVYGFTGSRSYPSVGTGFSSDEAIAVGRPGVATVLTDQAAGLTLIDLDAGTESVFPALHAKGMYVPGPTYDPDVWLLRPNDPGPLEAWDLAGPVPTLVPEKSPGFGQNNRAVALLDSTHMVFYTGNLGNSLQLEEGGTWTPVQSYRHEGDKQMRFSPDRTRLVTTTSGGAVNWFTADVQSGVPVWEVPTGEVAYLLPDTWALLDMNFSPDGSQLATVITRVNNGPRTLQILDAQSGAALHVAAFEGAFLAVAYDPFRPLLYLASKVEPKTVELTVISATTFEVVGRMQGPCSTTCLLNSPIVVSAANAVYFFDNGGFFDDGAHLASRFSLPPVGP